MQLGFWDFMAQIIPILVSGVLAAVIAMYFSDRNAFHNGYDRGFDAGWKSCEEYHEDVAQDADAGLEAHVTERLRHIMAQLPKPTVGSSDAEVTYAPNAGDVANYTAETVVPAEAVDRLNPPGWTRAHPFGWRKSVPGPRHAASD